MPTHPARGMSTLSVHYLLLGISGISGSLLIAQPPEGAHKRHVHCSQLPSCLP